jgi:uncharacterized protein (TIGR00725 family)
MKRKIQIGFIGSDADLKDGEEMMELAFQIGRLIAINNAVLVTSGEKRGGLTKAVAKGCIKEKGFVIGIMGNKKNALANLSGVVDIGTKKEGLREFFLINSSDCIIAMGGGSGTLNELTIAYQNKIPVICITKGTGWAKDLAGKFLDQRRVFKFEKASTANEAIKKALALGEANI